MVRLQISIVILFISLIEFITDFLWFKEMGYIDVFFKQLFTQLEVGIPTFIVLTILVELYLTHLRKSYFRKVESDEVANMKILGNYIAYKKEE